MTIGKSILFQNLVKFRCGVSGITEYETFNDDENIDDFIINHELLCIEQQGFPESVWDEYINWFHTEFVGVKVTLKDQKLKPTFMEEN